MDSSPHHIPERYKYVAGGGWTKATGTDTVIRVRGTTLRDGITIQPAWTPWFEISFPEPAPGFWVEYCRVFCYPDYEVHQWKQLSQHQWAPPFNSTNTGVQGGY